MALAAAVAAGAATPANATIVLCGPNLAHQCPKQGENVLFNKQPQQGEVVTGTTNLGTQVIFRGTTEDSNIIVAQGGQAKIEGADNTDTPKIKGDSFLLTSLNFQLANNSDGTFNFFDNLTLALQGGNATEVTFVFDTNIGQETLTFDLANGNGFFRFDAIHGQAIARVSLSFAGPEDGVFGIDDVSQIRLDDAEVMAAIPEPATWAMFLMGFGAIGYSMRSRKVGYKALQAV
jgi:hypothetical protein